MFSQNDTFYFSPRVASRKDHEVNFSIRVFISFGCFFVVVVFCEILILLNQLGTAMPDSN